MPKSENSKSNARHTRIIASTTSNDRKNEEEKNGDVTTTTITAALAKSYDRRTAEQ